MSTTTEPKSLTRISTATVPAHLLRDALRATALPVAYARHVILAAHDGVLELRTPTISDWESVTTFRLADGLETPDATIAVTSSALRRIVTASLKGRRGARAMEILLSLEILANELVITVDGVTYTVDRACATCSDDISRPPLLENVHTLTTAALRPALQRVIPAACTERTLPVLGNLQLTMTSSTCQIIGTDRYRLASSTIAAENDADACVLVPAQLLAKSLPYFHDAVTLTTGSDGEYVLTSGPVTVFGRPLGSFPRIAHILQAAGDGLEAVASVADLDSALVTIEAALEAAGERHAGCRILIGQDRLTLVAGGNTETGVEVPAVVSVGDDVDRVNWGLNPAYFRAALKVSDGDTVTLIGDGPCKPMLFTAGEGDDRHVVMQMRMPPLEG